MDRIYYSETIGTPKEMLNLRKLSAVFVYIVGELTKQDYFKEFFGYEDSFGRVIEGTMGSDFEVYSLSVVGRTIESPFFSTNPKYSEADLFDCIQLLYDNVTLKSFENEEDDYADGNFNTKKAKKVYLEKINKQLERYGNGWELLETGTIREYIGEGLKELIDNMAVYGDEENVDMRIKRASKSFLKYGATELDKKGALLEIAGALEFVRPEMKAFTSEEEQIIHQLLNRFDLRHNNRTKISGYDTEIYYPWMFYSFLSTYNAFVKMKQKKSNS